MGKREIAEERINRLFELAEIRVENDQQGLADRYVELARKIGMRYQVSIPRELRTRYCHECYSFLTPGRNCRVRINSKSKVIEYHCTECGKVNRYGF